MTADFSIVLPAYESDPGLLVRQLDAIRGQTWPSWELIVVDDGSPTVDVAGLVRGWAGDDPRVRVIRRARNGGIAVATNDGLDAATGVFVVFVDHDDLILPGALRAVRDAVLGAPGVDAVYTDEAIVDEHGRVIAEYRKPDFSPRRLCGQPYINHLTALRRSVLAEHRLRTEREPSQDFDLLLRVLPQARAVAHVPEVLYHWRAVAGSTAAAATEKPGVARAVTAAVTDHVRRMGDDAEVEPVAGDPNAVVVRYRSHLPVTVDDIDLTDRDTPRIAAAVLASTAQVIRLGASSAIAVHGSIDSLVAEALRPGVGLVGPRLVSTDGRLVSAGRTHHDGLADVFTGIDADNPGPWGAFHVAREVASVAPVGMVVARDRLTSTGGLPAGLPLDVALAVAATRLRRAGAPSVWTPAATLTLPEGTRGLTAGDIDPQAWEAAVEQCPDLADDPFAPTGSVRVVAQPRR